MNKTISTLLICLFSAFNSIAQDPLLEKIPSSSLFVVSLKTTNLLEKLDMDVIKNLDMVQDFKNKTKKSAKKDSSIVEQLFQDPSVYGIYCQPSSYLYLDYESSENPTPSVGFLVPLKPGKKFEKLIISIIGKEKFNEVFEKKKGYTWTEDDDFAIAYTNSYLLIYNFSSRNSPLTLDEKVETLVNGDNQSIASNKEFMEFQSKQTDLYYWMSMGSLFENAYSKSSDEDKKIFDYFKHFKNLQFGYRINFNPGTINYQSEAYLSEDLTNNLDKIYGNGIPQEMLKLVPQEDLYALVSMSYNMEESQKLTEEALKEFGERIKEKIGEEIVKKELEDDSTFIKLHDAIEEDTSLSYFEKFGKYDEIDTKKDSIVEAEKESGITKIDSILAEYGTKKEDLWSLFNGNFLAAVNGTIQVVDTFETYDYTENEDGDFGYFQVEKTRNIEIPKFKVILDTKNPKLLQVILDSITSKGLLNKEEGYYSFSLTQYDYFVVLTESNIILSNDKKFITENLNGYNKELQITAEHAQVMREKPMYFYLDLQKTIQASKKSLEDNKQAIMVLDEVEKTFYDINSTGEIKNNHSYGELNLNFVDKKNNSLISILNMANNLYVTFTKQR